MADIRQLPVMTAADAKSIGFGTFNDVPTLPVDIPDHDFTISARTSDGRRLTIYFGVYGPGRPPEFVDIQYHDAATVAATSGGATVPTFDFFGTTPNGVQTFDSRTVLPDHKPTFLCVLMDRPDQPESA